MLLVVDRQRHVVEQVAGETKTMLVIDPKNVPGLPMSSIVDAEIAMQVTADRRVTGSWGVRCNEK